MRIHLKEKSEEMYKYFSEDMMNWKTFSIFVKKIETMGIFTSLIKKLKLMRLQKKKKLKDSHLLKKENTEILVLSLSGRFIISNNTGDTSVNILVDGVAELNEGFKKRSTDKFVY
jgi:hypothetical protein